MTEPDRTRTDLDAPTAAARPAAPIGAHATRGTARDAVDAQHARYGGIKWGAAFFGWLSANGLAVLLLAILSAAGVAFGLTQVSSADQAQQEATAQAETIGITGGIALLVVLFLAYLAGGYVAGRMARFDGARQGLGVFLWAIIIAAALAIAGVIGGSEWNVLQRLDLPRLPVDEGDLTTGGIIALVAGLLTMLVAAVLGGKLGERFHHKVDRHAVDGKL